MKILLLAFALLLSSCAIDRQLSDALGQMNTAVLGSPQTALTQQDIVDGLKQALEVGSSRATAELSRPNGFWGNQLLRIALPPEYQRLQSTLTAVGLGSMFDDLHLKLNRAAESATQRAKPIFLNAILGLTIQDGMAILNGGNTAATDLLETRTSPQLAAAFTPIVNDALAQVQMVQEIEAIRSQIRSIPFASYLAPQLETDIATYTVQQTLNGVFLKLAEEETAIRQNPAKRTTELLRRVFSE